jgi:hypothetical protein
MEDLLFDIPFPPAGDFSEDRLADPHVITLVSTQTPSNSSVATVTIGSWVEDAFH